MTLGVASAADQARRTAATLRGIIARQPLSAVRWTLPQRDWLALRASRKLLRAGNQIGKTWAGLAEVIYRARGHHPCQPVRRAPVEIWIVCTSWAQSVAIMGKFWALVPRDEILPVSFDSRRGFGKDNPAVRFRNGSIVRFRTTNQGAEAFAGATIDYVHIDEPCDEDVYRELDRRVLRRGGSIGITLTPVNRPTGFLRELVAGGGVQEVHATLSVANLTPIGGREPLRLADGTLMDQAWIDEQRRITPASIAGVVLDGDWETKPEGAWFKCWSAQRHVSARMKLDPTRGAIRHVLGFDYATADRQYGHCAVLSQVQQYRDERGRLQEVILVLDEVATPGTCSNADFARQVLAMLDRNGLTWRKLDHVHGDNPIVSRWVEKSNTQTMRALAIEMGIPSDSLQPRVQNAKDNIQSAAAYDEGWRYLYERLAAGMMIVHPRCEVLARAFEVWDYTKKHPYKDILDALRYALKPFIFAPVLHTAGGLRFR